MTCLHNVDNTCRGLLKYSILSLLALRCMADVQEGLRANINC